MDIFAVGDLLMALGFNFRRTQSIEVGAGDIYEHPKDGRVVLLDNSNQPVDGKIGWKVYDCIQELNQN